MRCPVPGSCAVIRAWRPPSWEEARAQRGVAGQVSNPIGSYQYTGDTPRQHVTVSQRFDWLLVRESNRSAAGAVVTRAEAESAWGDGDGYCRRSASFLLRGARQAAQQALGLARASKRIADSLRLIADRRFAGGDISRFEDDQVALEAARVGQLVSRAREALTGCAEQSGAGDSMVGPVQ